MFGEGSPRARIVFVGEQPGDAEDRRGRPFVGPAGRLLDRALAEAGIDRGETYVTNAVKHFKWEPAGKRRLHKKPGAREIAACRPWLEAGLCRPNEDGKRPLNWSDITSGQKIAVEAEVAKTNTRGVIGFCPRARTHWLAPFRKTNGVICPVLEFDDVKAKLIKAINKERKERNQPLVKFKQNCFRHSFATYACAFWQDGGRAQLYLRQRDKDVLWNNYRDYATEDDARLYMGSPWTRTSSYPLPRHGLPACGGGGADAVRLAA